MKLIRFVLAAFLLSSVFAYEVAQAQFIAYSQYNNAPLLTNPARASLTDYTQVTFHYRWSRVANYQVPSVSFVLPFFRQTNGLRYGGVGVNIISQQAGPGGLYKVTGATGAFAYTIHLSRKNHIAAGLGGGMINKRVDASGITTDSQFNFGAFDPSLANGENIQSNSVTRPVINTGFCWVLTDYRDREKASLGVAAYNVNRPSFGLLENAAREQVTYVATGEVEVLKRESVSLSPTFRYIYDGTSIANLGARISYTPDLTDDVLSAAVWYKTTGAIVAAAQYDHKVFVLAASMDFSTAADLDVSINSAFEISLGWRLNRKERKKPNPAKAITSAAATSTLSLVVTDETSPVTKQPPVDSLQEPVTVEAEYRHPAGSTETLLTEAENLNGSK